MANGKNMSLEEASRRNGIRGGSTLHKWMNLPALKSQTLRRGIM
jgi:hypothetical protein